jgi:hypothetical protein
MKDLLSLCGSLLVAAYIRANIGICYTPAQRRALLDGAIGRFGIGAIAPL